ncbi:MAG TPA: hypothetical protein VK961_13725 [Chthoniobacter sp.]|nr:hypothetical protein [Chthoniobacter sp.]
MRKPALCLLAAITFAACDRPEAKEETPEPTPTPKVAQRVAASPTPNPNWMWKDEKGKPRDVDPLSVKNNGLDRAKKK